MIFGYVILLVAVTISLVAAYYSIMGLTAIFAAAVVPIIIMGGALELGKVISTVWLHNNWRRVPVLFKVYLVPAVAFLMFLTSMGIFGFLSKAHSDQNLVSGDITSKIAIYDEKIKTQKDNIESARRALQQMDAAVDQTMSRSNDEKGADKATAIRRSQARERSTLQNEISRAQGEIVKLNDLRAPIAAEVRKVEAEVGPIKYIAAMIYGDNPDANILERAVRWVIILIVVVFDPLALTLILAANKQFEWALHGVGGWVHDDDPKPRSKNTQSKFMDRIRNRFKKKDNDGFVELDAVEQEALNRALQGALQESYEPAESTVIEELTPDEIDSVNKMAAEYAELPQEPDYTDYSKGAFVNTHDPESEEELPVVKKPRWSGFSFPMSSIFNKPKEEVQEEPVLITRIAYPESNYNTSMDERPGDYVEQPVQQVIPEAAPGTNRGIDSGADAPEVGVRRKYVPQSIQADNTPQLGHPSSTDFGTEFPSNPRKGDVYLRTDYLPNRLFKFNDYKWIEVDKDQTDLYAYDNMYIKHLIEEIDAGRYDTEMLTNTEREQIAQYLNKN